MLAGSARHRESVSHRSGCKGQGLGAHHVLIPSSHTGACCLLKASASSISDGELGGRPPHLGTFVRCCEHPVRCCEHSVPRNAFIAPATVLPGLQGCRLSLLLQLLPRSPAPCVALFPNGLGAPPGRGAYTCPPWKLQAQPWPPNPTPSSTPAYVLVAQSCSTLCDPVDHSPAGYSVHGIL